MIDTRSQEALRRGLKPFRGTGRRGFWGAGVELIILGFTVRRLLIDIPSLAAGTLPDEEYHVVIPFSIWFLACLLLAFPRHPGERHGEAPTLDDSHLRDRHRSWHDSHLDWVVPSHWLSELPGAISASFWLGLSLHALIAELWLRARPAPSRLAPRL